MLSDRCIHQFDHGRLNERQREARSSSVEYLHDAAIVVATTDFPKENAQDVLTGHVTTDALVASHPEHTVGVRCQVREQLVRTDSPEAFNVRLGRFLNLVDVLDVMRPDRSQGAIDIHDGRTDGIGGDPAALENAADKLTGRSAGEPEQQVLASDVGVMQFLRESLRRCGNSKRIGGKAFEHDCLPA